MRSVGQTRSSRPASAEVPCRPPQRSPQVRAAYITDEQRVAGEDGLRPDAVFQWIESEDRDRFHSVTGRFEDLEPQTREVEGIAVFHGDERIFGFCSGPEMNLSAATIPEFEMTGHEIGVEVG